MAENTAAFRIGDRLNQYDLLGVLGQGGHAVVFHGHDKASARDVAIKVIQNPKHDLKLRARAEADLLIRLRHPHLVEVYDAGVAEDGSVYIVMEKLEGRSLREIIVRLHKLTVLEALPIAIQIASGVLAAHARKVVHRDLKPDNVFVCPDGTVKVLDFGIAKYLERSFDTTQKRMWQGTPSYMAPEQFQGLPVSYRSDVFALGVILYELIGGIKPSHVGGAPTSVEQFAIRQLAVDPPMLHKLDDSVPASVSRMIRRAIAKAPDDRFDMDELLKKMQSELHSERKRSGRAAPRDLIRACLDVTDPDCVPAFTALSQRATRPTSAPVTHDGTLPGLGSVGASQPSFADSHQRLLTERLAELEPQPTHTAQVCEPVLKTNPELALSSKILDVPRGRAGLGAALLVSASVGCIGIFAATTFGSPEKSIPSARPVALAKPKATAAPPPAPLPVSSPVKREAAVLHGGIGAARAMEPTPEPVASASDVGKAGAPVASARVTPSKSPGTRRSERSTSPRGAALDVSSGLGQPLLRVGSGLAEAPVTAAERKDTRPLKNAGSTAPEKRAGKLWFPPK